MVLQRLLLWDIDATLITSGGAGEKALKSIVARRFRTTDDLIDIEIAGRTDVFIARAILQKYGVAQTADNVTEFLDEYLALLAQNLPLCTGRVLPGIGELLARTSANPSCVVGLLTGNLQRGAQLKLEHYGLWRYFSFGAFADDHHDRNELGAFAQRRALEKFGHEFAGTAIDVIGDTGHDIACGKAFGARTIAVATGSWTHAQLTAEKPDFVFDDLARVDDVIAALGW